MRYLTTIAVVMAVLVTAGAVRAHWDESDGHKMEHPQLPDENGWDVRITNSRRAPTEPLEWIVADDWRCAGSGPVTDVHFWVSWMQEQQDNIANIHLSIHDDIPADTGGVPHSRPAEPALWDHDFGFQLHLKRRFIRR